MLTGNTIFGGDSITVGLAPFVQVSGDKLTLAKVGQSSAAVLGMIRDAETAGTLSQAKNLVILAGTNDIGGGLSAEAIFGNLQSIWSVGKSHGLRIIAITIPPAKGYTGWNGRDDSVDAKRRAVNALIQSSPIPNQVLDSDNLMGSNGALLQAFDSGDHLHPRKDKMGAAMNGVLTDNPVPRIAPNALGTAGMGAGTKVVLGGSIAAGVGYGLYYWWNSRK